MTLELSPEFLTETPTDTATETATVTLEPTAEITEAVLPTAEITAEATADQTEAVMPVQPEITNTVTASALLLPEPTLTPVLSEAFHTTDLSRWNISTGWELVAQEQGFALQVTNSDTPVSSNIGLYDDIAVEILVQSETGTFHLHLRDAYRLILYPTGQVELYRGATLLATTTVAVSNAWQHVRFSAIGDTLRVAINNVEVIALRDTEPTLTAGQIAFNAAFPQQPGNSGQHHNILLVDNIRFWIPESKLPAATHTVTLTPSVTFVPTITPIPPLDVTNTVIPSVTIEPIAIAQPSATAEPTASLSTSVEESSAAVSEPIIQQEFGGDEWCAEFNFTSTSVDEFVTARTIGGETRGRYVSNVQDTGWQPCDNCFGDDMVSLDISFPQIATVTSVEFQLSGDLEGVNAYGSLGQWDGESHENGDGISNQQTDPLTGTQTVASFTLTPAYTNANGINIGYDDTIGAGPEIDIAIQRLRMAGTGQNPFPSAYDCPVIPPTPTPTPTSTLTETPTATPTATATATLTNTPTPTLSDYGVILSGSWDINEQNTILVAVHNVALALYAVANRPDLQPHEVFKQVMIGNEVTGLEIVEADLPVGGGNGACKTDPDGTDNYFTITCDTPLLDQNNQPITITEYTIVHELGHLFVGRTGGTQLTESNGTLTFYSQLANDTINISDKNDRLVMGTRILDLNIAPYDSGANDWWRGDRGWGTHAVPFPTNFQQNTDCILDDDINADTARKTREREEAVADMFLNWVYWKNTVGVSGFQNVDWLRATTTDGTPVPPSEATFGGCPITQQANPQDQPAEAPGTARANGTDSAVVAEVSEILGQ